MQWSLPRGPHGKPGFRVAHRPYCGSSRFDLCQTKTGLRHDRLVWKQEVRLPGSVTNGLFGTKGFGRFTARTAVFTGRLVLNKLDVRHGRCRNNKEALLPGMVEGVCFVLVACIPEDHAKGRWCTEQATPLS
jgi:hypothetical protein